MQAYEVIVIGAGPTGLALANILGMHQVRTLVVERNAGTVGEPRAVSIDDESLRTLQYLGLYERIRPRINLGYGAQYFDTRGRCFAQVMSTLAEYGYPRRSAFRQPSLEAVLREGLARYPSVEVRFNTEMTAFENTADGVLVHLRRTGPGGESGAGESGSQESSGQESGGGESSGDSNAVRARYMAACDGGRSAVREALGVVLSGSTYDERWLIVDLEGSQDTYRHTLVYCDPSRPALALPGPENTRRYEFMTLPGDRDEDLLDEATIRRMLARHSGADAGLKIARKVIYHFHARIADRWRVGRVFLAGDAAHLSPPFAGQGMNSGLRDAHNLGWKLAAVARGDLGESLLDSYQSERRPHAWALIQMAITMGHVMMPRSWLNAFLVQNGLRLLAWIPAARDYVMQMKYKPKPQFTIGFMAGEAGAALRGRMFVQPRVERPDGSEVLLDELIGPGFALIQWHQSRVTGTRSSDLPAGLPSSAGRSPDRSLPLGARSIEVLRKHERFVGEYGEPPVRGHQVRDVSGVLGTVMDTAGVRAVIIRPDRYVAGCVASDAPAGEEHRLLQQLYDRSQKGFTV